MQSWPVTALAVSINRQMMNRDPKACTHNEYSHSSCSIIFMVIPELPSGPVSYA